MSKEPIIKEIEVSVHAVIRETSDKVTEDDLKLMVKKLGTMFTMEDLSREFGFYKFVIFNAIFIIKKERLENNIRLALITAYTINDAHLQCNINIHEAECFYQGTTIDGRLDIPLELLKKTKKQLKKIRQRMKETKK